MPSVGATGGRFSMYRRRRSSAEWREEEERRSERSRVRGLRYTMGSFLLSFLALAAFKVVHWERPLGPLFWVLGGLAVGTLLMILASRKKG